MTTFGRELRRLMVERGVGVRALSRRVPCNPGYLSKLRQDQQTPSDAMARRLEAALDAEGSLVPLTEPSSARRRGERPVDLFGVDLPDVNGRPVDAAYVESIRETSQALVRLDTVHGGNDVLPLALRAFRVANRKLGSGAYERPIERDLIAATGEIAEVAAWLAFDADRQEVSRQVIHEALMLSRAAGDRDMELFELTHMAMQSVHLHRPAEAVRLTADVVDGRRPSPRVTALFDIRRGRALAQLGDKRRALDALGRARATLKDGITAADSPWTWWITDAEVLWHTGMAHAELGEWGAAVPLLRETADRRAAYQRARYNDLVHLLNALVHVADWREAEPVLGEVAAQVGEVGSTRTANLLARTVGRIARTDAPSTVAAISDEVQRRLHQDLSRQASPRLL
ncbi:MULTISPECIES: helix-turn-helix domain-containing protein [Actinomadura]|uniref:Helix-turn-helix domain-containing protein n=1 Tax=Actinomadura yumaensis TaxID=111807 RepID=A0ABW2CPQ0_9ACTN|nr:helix-turn-helix transcriptional regulator [Actinomadura sp. J1-007]MWK35228.1 hypothetical protein [Actinomadura sp. J1-007]